MWNRHLLLFVLLNLLLGFAQAEERTHSGESSPTGNEEFSVSVKEDSSAIYRDLIAEEALQADLRPNVTGMIFGGVYVGMGAGFLAGGIVTLNSFADESFYRVLGATFIVVAVPFYLVGFPILISNIYEYAVNKGHANRRDEYADALKRYKQRQGNPVQISIFPTVNLANNSIGLGTALLF